jgi:hypothetical protein
MTYLFIRKLLPQHAEGILAYAAKHNYLDILDLAVSSAIKTPLHETASLLPTHLVVPWVTKPCTSSIQYISDVMLQVKYYEQWNKLWRDSVSDAINLWGISKRLCCHSCGCGIEKYLKRLLTNLGGGIACLADLDTVIGSDGCCDAFRENFSSWRNSVEKNIADVRPFGSFL